ncbi:hypothetical protein ACVWZ4_002487 [Bradyrhizobium sp. USDA 4472]
MTEPLKLPSGHDESGSAQEASRAQRDRKDETAGIPHNKFEHDLGLPEDVDSRYSPEFIAKRRELILRLKKQQGSAEQSETSRTARGGMTRDELMKKSSADPRFVSATDQAPEMDPSYLVELIAEVMAANPNLTKEKAREMLLASGA